jgi:GT2 family glycosyltransferase
MQNLYWALIGGTDWQNNDIVCFMNTDLEFDKDFFTIVEHNIEQGEILIPKVYEDGKLVDGGISINWAKKSFKPGYRIDCFSPRGICMTVKDFRESGGFRWRLLPHYGSDYDWSIRQLKRGLTAKRLPGFNIYHRKHSRPTAGRFSKLNPANPWYWTIFIILHCPKKYWLINILKAWL